MNEALATWELIALGAIGLVVIFLFFPGLRRLSEESRNAPKDWPGFLLPIGAVILVVVLLVMVV
ncbi:MAG: hypothetical protein OXI60_11790 [Acidiferrobacterales bacterium]|nr:hypothetical protein [Acidiferrobacterales bacterium]